MTAGKIALGVGGGILLACAVLAVGCLACSGYVVSKYFGASEELAESPPLPAAPLPKMPPRLLRRVGGQGQLDFAVAKGAALEDAVVLEGEARAFCDDRRGDFCKVLVWSAEEDTPTSLPIDDSALAMQIAHYGRNRSTGWDCFYLMQDGEPVKATHSEGCGGRLP